MPIQKAVCPECGAGLKCTDPAGFAPGEAVECPKCQTYFEVGSTAAAAKVARPAVARPAAAKAKVVDDEDDYEADDRPRKKKKPQKAAPSTGYVVMRVAVLAVLLTVMCVLGYLLYQKHFAGDAGGSDGSGDDLPPVTTPRVVNPEKAPKLERKFPGGVPGGGGGDKKEP